MDLRSRMGEELTDEEKEQMRKFREEQMKKRDMEKMQERMEKMQEMMKKMPLEMNAVIRNQMLVRIMLACEEQLSNLIKVLEYSQYEKLTVMTEMAVRQVSWDV